MMKSLVIFCLTYLLGVPHPFYMSVTDLKYNAKEKSLEGSVKIFVNDLENSLRKITGKPVDLIHVKDKDKITALLKNYLQKRLVIKVNGSGKSLEVIGFEHEAENIWIYIEVKDCASPKKIEIENSILYEHLKEQINVVHFEINAQKQSLKVVNPEKMMKFSF